MCNVFFKYAYLGDFHPQIIVTNVNVWKVIKFDFLLFENVRYVISFSLSPPSTIKETKLKKTILLLLLLLLLLLQHTCVFSKWLSLKLSKVYFAH